MKETLRIPSQDAGRNGRSAAMQKWGALIGGSALAFYGLTRRSPLGFAMAAGGGALIYAGTKTDLRTGREMARGSVLLNTSPEEAYRFWHNFENFPRFMHHLDSVTVTDNRRSRWVALGPGGTRLQWEAEIISDLPNERIAWRSLPGSDVSVDGWVEFDRAPGNRGTVVTANVQYRPPGGALGSVVAKLTGKNPKFLIQQDLRRFKALMETGEIPTTEGQPHGPRDVVTAAARLVDPDRPLRREAAREMVSARRGA